jgi:hypothetical protein
MSMTYLDHECDFCEEPAVAHIQTAPGLKVSTSKHSILCWSGGDVAVCAEHETQVNAQLKKEG